MAFQWVRFRGSRLKCIAASEESRKENPCVLGGAVKKCEALLRRVDACSAEFSTTQSSVVQGPEHRS